MQTCNNCEEGALYVYSVNPAFPIYYCALHLPKFLKSQKDSGAVKYYEPPAPKATKKSTKTEAPAEPEEESTPTEE
jgi:hypothetical protein